MLRKIITMTQDPMGGCMKVSKTEPVQVLRMIYKTA
jgi:hypothetical protein